MTRPGRTFAAVVLVTGLLHAACGSSASSGDGASDEGGGGTAAAGEAASGAAGEGGAAGGATEGAPGAGGGPGTTCSASANHSGQATYYQTADGTGNCSFDATSDPLIGAMNHTDYDGAAACGACVALTGPSGSITIRVVDQCPECPPGNIDLSPGAFGKIAALSAGRVPITWQYVACDVDGPIHYYFKDGSSKYWTAVQIRNHRYAIAKVEVASGAGDFQEMPRQDYNYFVADQGAGEGPYRFRVTDVNGSTLTDDVASVDQGADEAGAAQFVACP